jgi:hypothetical protein
MDFRSCLLQGKSQGICTRQRIERLAREALNKLLPFMVRQAHHERTQQLTVVEGFNQRFPKVLLD